MVKLCFYGMRSTIIKIKSFVIEVSKRYSKNKKYRVKTIFVLLQVASAKVRRTPISNTNGQLWECEQIPPPRAMSLCSKVLQLYSSQHKVWLD